MDTTVKSVPDVASYHVALNCKHIRFKSASLLRRILYWWWVVPRTQWDFDDLDYQLYTFEVFHTDWRSKLAHDVTIPAIAFFCMVFLASSTSRAGRWPTAPWFMSSRSRSCTLAGAAVATS